VQTRNPAREYLFNLKLISMSRSRKFPIFKDHSGKFGKKQANKRIRKSNSLQGFIGFQFLHKLYESWNIYDWKYSPTEQDWIDKAKRK
jgi:hypothetical protein